MKKNYLFLYFIFFVLIGHARNPSTVVTKTFCPGSGQNHVSSNISNMPVGMYKVVISENDGTLIHADKLVRR